MGNVDNRISEFLRSLTFFSGLPEADMRAFLDTATVRDYKKGETLFHQGDAAEYLFVIISGWAKLSRSTAEGEEAMVALFTRGDVFAEAALFQGSVYPLSAYAAEDARVLAIPGAVLKGRAQKNPDITVRMLASLSREIQNLQRQNEQMAIMSAPQRVSCLLLQLSSHMIGNGGTMMFPYDKSLAAARLGMTPETFSRALAQLRPYGVTTSGPEIRIESFARLTEYSCGHCTALPGECKGCRVSASCPLKNLKEQKRVAVR
jgi:CRP/FNR family transcriptional regulator, dissimilatory nitrate respiration regulator